MSTFTLSTHKHTAAHVRNVFAAKGHAREGVTQGRLRNLRRKGQFTRKQSSLALFPPLTHPHGKQHSREERETHTLVYTHTYNARRRTGRLEGGKTRVTGGKLGRTKILRANWSVFSQSRRTRRRAAFAGVRRSGRGRSPVTFHLSPSATEAE